ncbi:MAG: hypothetical protein M3123_06415 [Actinomycetota bacterium]|nr:hypothetical protein [Actinomycetota bacterium]
MSLRNGKSWREFVVGLGAATVAAAAFWAVGLSEVMWAPYYLAAVESGRRSGSLSLPRRRTRS